jgi:hypothetical protein
MIRVLAFVEGPTEEKFIRELIAPGLWSRGIIIVATTPGRKRLQGGVQTWPRARNELLHYLKEDQERYVTTMFDYYGMPSRWPGRAQARSVAYPHRATTVEDAMASNISVTMGNSFHSKYFIPYVQMHEFEALLFSKPDTLGTVIHKPGATEALKSIASEFSTPEEIDDNPRKAPSKRILSISRQYQKVVHGNIASQRIGLDVMRHACPHFNQWLTKLESLA